MPGIRFPPTAPVAPAAPAAALAPGAKKSSQSKARPESLLHIKEGLTSRYVAVEQDLEHEDLPQDVTIRHHTWHT